MNAIPLEDLVHDLVGLPFEEGARGPAAFDCWGLVREVARREGRKLPDWDREHLNETGRRWLMNQHAPGLARPVFGAPEDGNIAYHERRAHVGVVVNGGILHASRGLGVVWQRRRQFEMLYPGSVYLRWLDG